ncbi:hypothetical protein BH18ACT15_BH18ACT15_01570 [soil metagenome]
MAEELRFFLRIALYMLVAAAVYWIMVPEHAGAILLLFLGGATTFFVGSIAYLVRQTHAEITMHDAHRRRASGAVELADRIIGFEEHHGEAHEGPLTIQEQTVPTASVWPVLGAAGILLLVLGFLYGPWLWVPAMLIGLYVVLGWLTQLTR